MKNTRKTNPPPPKSCVISPNLSNWQGSQEHLILNNQIEVQKTMGLVSENLSSAGPQVGGLGTSPLPSLRCSDLILKQG